MSSANVEEFPNRGRSAGSHAAGKPTGRVSSVGDDPTVFADIFRDDVNIAIWQRDISASLREVVGRFLDQFPYLEKAFTVAPADASAAVISVTNGKAPLELADEVAELVDMFCYLFDLKRAGLRLAALNRAMCPRFHVDRIPCRLVTTYHGVATEWLPHHAIGRATPGPGSQRQPGFAPGLYADLTDTRHLSCGDVALLKGSLWDGNEHGGLVHRSPEVPAGESRLMLSLDFSQ
ncbi:MAG: DUF1826 domain-containing protein [Pseudomonadota bacterium]